MDASSYHDHGTFRDVIYNAFSDAVEAGNPVPFSVLLTFAFAVFEATRCCQRDV